MSVILLDVQRWQMIFLKCSLTGKDFIFKMPRFFISKFAIEIVMPIIKKINFYLI